jgi:hypothetical protein
MVFQKHPYNKKEAQLHHKRSYLSQLLPQTTYTTMKKIQTQEVSLYHQVLFYQKVKLSAAKQ